MLSLWEEAGELAAALLNNDKLEIVDAIGRHGCCINKLSKARRF
jgi:hypothetical protein